MSARDSLEAALQVRLRVLDSFVCSGAACPDNCCHGWRVEVEPQTLARWNAAEPASVAEWLQRSLDHGEGDAAPALRRANDGRCVHQDEAGLCAMQSRLGHQWLPETCRSYPRASVRSHNSLLETAHLSCPEVVALLFRQWRAGEPPFEVARAGAAEPPAVSELAAVQRYFQWYVHQVMGWSGPLGVRLYDIAGVLSFMARKAAAHGLSESALGDKAGRKTQAIERRLVRTAQQYANRKLAVSAALRKRFWAWVWGSGQVFEGPWARSFLELGSLPDVLAAGGDGKAMQDFIRRAAARLADANPAAQPFLERYLEVKLQNHGFPRNPFAGNYTATFLDCVLPLCQCQLLLWGMAEAGAAVDDAAVQRTIYSVEKSVSHNTRIFDYLKRNPLLMEPDQYREALLELG